MADSLQEFRWTGIDANGNRVSGKLQAQDAKDAQLELKRKGVEIISFQTTRKMSGKVGSIFNRNAKIKPKDILLFTRYVSTMLAAGLPIMQVLEIVGQDQENPTMHSLIAAVRKNVSEGKTLADSFSKYPMHFNELYCNLIRAGETSGTLDKSLNRLGNYMERTENLKRKIKKALVYPIAILSIAMIVSLVLLVFVVPQFQSMFQSFGADLPFFTRMIVNLSNFILKFWWLIIAGIVGLIFWLKWLMRTSEKAKAIRDKYILKLYIIGPIIRQGIIARFTRTLSTTLEAGMPIVESLKSMPEMMGNKIYGEAIERIREEVTKGNQLSAVMAQTKLFPNMVIQMISVGEVSGSLPTMLNKVADYYEEEVNAIVDNLSSLLEPVIMLVLGTIVGVFVVAMYLPIFKLGSLF